MRSSKAAFDFIVKEEVGSKQLYEQRYRQPEWPGERSGPTVGIGYDLGQTLTSTIRHDWQGVVPNAMLEAMVSCSGHTGSAGKLKTLAVRDAIEISWVQAIKVHQDQVIPRWEGKLVAALPNIDKLKPDSIGALLSLIFNRGVSFDILHKPERDPLDRYREMRAIKAHMAAQNFEAIPDEFRSMKRLWPNTKGLRDRRDREATLFERGLNGPAAAGTASTVIVTGGAGAAAAAKSGAGADVIVGILMFTFVAAIVGFLVMKHRRRKASPAIQLPLPPTG